MLADYTNAPEDGIIGGESWLRKLSGSRAGSRRLWDRGRLARTKREAQSNNFTYPRKVCPYLSAHLKPKPRIRCDRDHDGLRAGVTRDPI